MKYKSIKLFLIFLLAILLASCGSDKASDTSTDKAFYDLAGFINSEIAPLEKANTPLIKSIILEGKHEQHTLKNADWKKELAVFIDADINRPAWRDKYARRDTTEGYLDVERYIALDDNLKVQVMEIKRERETGIITWISADQIYYSILHDSEKKLIYLPQRKTYFIQSKQQGLFGSEKSFEIKGKWY